ncbi:sensor histidine kinase [Catalinimonas niigatensis]|uniref:sensor histidine kinase n=1 Tax=Catalinimonas niigatensis TaxID=1397264 RepID=UPI002665AB5A|nr:PAS domain-containing sensor histidine kinase [Catalinimonas niigatensis]WPP50697.1 PAS domain-containing sensor histidine kinase [Catalinimonas niigatensis]
MESAFMPHGHCYYWEPFILWSHAISDSIIAIAYFVIPLSLIRIVKARNDFKYMWMLILFAIFILGCGATHVMDVINIWEPFYRTDSVIRIITALASIGTALLLIFITPRLIMIPSAEQWKQLNEELLSLNESLESQVNERTAALQESGATFKFLTDTIPQIVWTAKSNGELDYYNDNWYSYTGLNKEESLASGWQKVIHFQDLQNVVNIWNHSVETGVKFQTEFRMRNAQDGSYRWHLGRALAMKDKQGNISKWFGTATDMHDQKQKSEELKRVNHELDNFVYTASHDLKAPVTNLEGLMNLIESRTPASCTDELHPLYFMMNKQIDKLKLIIHDLADVGRIEKDATEAFEKIEIRKIIDDFIVTHQEAIAKKEASIHTDLKPDHLYFSPIHLRSILYNLLDNAIKYSHPSMEPKVLIATELQDEYWVLKVSDNGIGIPEEYHDKIFEMFKRFNRYADGTGMGLYIVKRIVEKYQGEVSVVSETGKGATFVIKIPNTVVMHASE